jgi:hypothetical protein
MQLICTPNPAISTQCGYMSEHPTRRRWAAAPRMAEFAGDCGRGGAGTIGVVLAAERRRPFFFTCGPRDCGVSVNA